MQSVVCVEGRREGVFCEDSHFDDDITVRANIYDLADGGRCHLEAKQNNVLREDHACIDGAHGGHHCCTWSRMRWHPNSMMMSSLNIIIRY